MKEICDTSPPKWYILEKKITTNHIMYLKVENQIREVEEKIGHFSTMYVHLKHQNSIITCQNPKCFDVHITGRSLHCQVENHVQTKKIYFF